MGWVGEEGKDRRGGGKRKEGKDTREGKQGEREQGAPSVRVRGHRGRRSGMGQGPHLPEFLCPSQGPATPRQPLKVLSSLGCLVQHGGWWDAQHLHNPVHLVHLRAGRQSGSSGRPGLHPLQRTPSSGAHLIGATEEGLSSVHLHQDAAQGPHVNGQVVGCAQEHLGRTVETALDVLVNLGEERGQSSEVPPPQLAPVTPPQLRGLTKDRSPAPKTGDRGL